MARDTEWYGPMAPGVQAAADPASPVSIWRAGDGQLWATWARDEPTQIGSETGRRWNWWHARLPAPVLALPYERLQDLPLGVIERLWAWVSAERRAWTHTR